MNYALITDMKLSREEFEATAEIAREMASRVGMPERTMDLAMSLEIYCGNNETPLRLFDMLHHMRNGEYLGDISHDVFGIHRHLNRETGGLDDCFVPRFARVQQ